MIDWVIHRLPPSPHPLASRGEREANDELEARLFGSDRPQSSTTSVVESRSVITSYCLGIVSVSGMRGFMSAKRFP